MISDLFVHAFEKVEAVSDDVKHESSTGVSFHLVAQTLVSSVLALHEQTDLLQSRIFFQASG